MHASALYVLPRTSIALQATRVFANPYKILQITEDADSKQIKRAYRKLALR